VLDRMSGMYREAMTLILGTGMELGAVLAPITGGDVGREDSRTVVAHGTKNEGRMDRTIFVDRWAWPVVVKRARSVLPYQPLWPGLDGNTLRDHFYRAQVAARLIAEPPLDRYGQPLWGRVKGHHTIHDSRHTYSLCRQLGLDGEPRQPMKFCAMQCGQADEQMQMKVYTKLNIAERLRMIELAEAREAGRREAK
jgi:integrase